jgi:hypothetical protein
LPISMLLDPEPDSHSQYGFGSVSRTAKSMRLRIPVRIPIHNTGYNKEEFHLNREFSCKKSVRSFLPQFHFSSLQQPRDLKAAAHPRPRMLIIFYMFGSQILIFLRSTVVVCCFSFLQWYSHRFSHAFHIPHSS